VSRLKGRVIDPQLVNSICCQTQEKAAVYTGYGTLVNGYVNLGIKLNKTGKFLLSSYYTDSSLTIQQGLYQIFYPNAMVEREGYFESNLEDSEWKYDDSTGMRPIIKGQLLK